MLTEKQKKTDKQTDIFSINPLNVHFKNITIIIKQEGQRCHERRVAQEILTDRQTDKKWTNEQTEVHLFQKQRSYEDLSPCQV